MTTSIFSPDALKRIVDTTIPEQTGSFDTHVVVGAVDQAGFQIVASFKRQDHPDGFTWELQAAARHNWTGDNSVGGKVILSW